MNKYQTTIYNNITIHHHGAGDLISDKIIKSKNYFEYKLLTKLKKILNDSEINTIYEVGANIGNHIVFYNNEIHPSKIVAYEPLKRNLDVLNKNISENVVVKGFGLGDREQKVKFYVNNKNYGNSSIKQECTDEDTTIEKVIIKKWSNEVPKSGIDFIKVDIEGAEIYILDEIISSTISNEAILMIEIAYDHYSNADLIKMISNFDKLKEDGYKLVYFKDKDFIFKKSDDKTLYNNKLINKIKKEILISKVWRYRGLYEHEKDKTKSRDIILEYRKLINGKKIGFKPRMIWSIFYKFFVRPK